MRIALYYTIVLLCLLYHINCQIRNEFIQNITTINKRYQFSGIYLPEVKYNAEHYAGSWLTSRKRYLNARDSIVSIGNLEGGSFCMISTGPMLMTRDFFDFEVVHLSSTTNNLPSNNNQEFFKLLGDNMENNAKEIYATANKETFRRTIRKDYRLTNRTVALIPFASTPGSHDIGSSQSPLKVFTNRVRIQFFVATFWSIYRYISHIVVVVSSTQDYDMIKQLSLPIFELVDLSNEFNTNKYSRMLLPRETLKYGLKKFDQTENSLFIDDQIWKRFKYVYFSEADHILHLRHAIHIYNAMDKLNGTIALAPHRMQSIALPQAYPEVLNIWDNRFREKLLNVIFVTEDVIPKGSCCDNGRFVFKDCGGWWYNCERWGLSNYTTWIRFGKYGWTLPLATEHQGRCNYSPERITCPLPDNCQSRIPKNEASFCKEIPNIEKYQ